MGSSLADSPDERRKKRASRGDIESSGLALKLSGSDLFATLSGPAPALYRLFLRAADQRVLLRYGLARRGNAWVRIGLPGESADLFNARMSRVFLSMNSERTP